MGTHTCVFVGGRGGRMDTVVRGGVQRRQGCGRTCQVIALRTKQMHVVPLSRGSWVRAGCFTLKAVGRRALGGYPGRVPAPMDAT